jgi:D-tyrosyl-tRNA(Tyr) deacylase
VIAVVQRVARAEVRVEGAVVGKIGRGLMVLLGVERGDEEADADIVARKLAALRIFPGRANPAAAGRAPMDVTCAEVGGSCLVVSQFTLAGSIHKGNRPGFDRAEDPPRARALYERVVAQLRAAGLTVETGTFAAMMEVDLVNDGPVTFIVEARAGTLVKRA